MQPTRRRKEDIAPSEALTERVAHGKAERQRIPLEDHALFAPTEFRPDPLELLARQATSRVPELIPIRYGRMVASEFAFYRGAALIMASDLATTPTTTLRAQLCGDAHLSNFGFFASAERRLVFDLNDFDETLPGPFEWDLKRMVTSFEIAGRSQSFSPKDVRSIVLSTVRTYRESMRDFATMTNQAVWYATLDAENLLEQLRATVPASRLRKVEATLAEARTKDSMQAFRKMTQLIDGVPHIVSNPPLIVPTSELFTPDVNAELMSRMGELMSSYRDSLVSDRQHLLDQFRFLEMARKVVGVGSVGTRAWILLFEGVDGNDPLFLQAKEAQSSVLEQFLGVSEFSNHGERVVAGQRLMQASSDIFLGWQKTNGIDGIDRDYYVRQLRDWKASADVEAFNPNGMSLYARVCAWTLARAHARSGDRIALAAYLGKKDTFDQAIAAFASAYADQNERDYSVLRAAVSSGKIVAEEGV